MRAAINPDTNRVDFAPRGITHPEHEKGATRPRPLGHTPSAGLANTVFATVHETGDPIYTPQRWPVSPTK